MAFPLNGAGKITLCVKQRTGNHANSGMIDTLFAQSAKRAGSAAADSASGNAVPSALPYSSAFGANAYLPATAVSLSPLEPGISATGRRCRSSNTMTGARISAGATPAQQIQTT